MLFRLVAVIACLAGPSLNGAALGTPDLVTRMYLDIDGIDGGVIDPGFEDQIHVFSYSGTVTGGPGEISLVKPLDSSSPALLLLAAQGTPLRAATLRVVQTLDGKVASRLTIDMQTVLITGVVVVAETETITFLFQGSKVTTKNGGVIDTDPVAEINLDIKGIAGDVIDVLSYSWTQTSGPGEMSLIKNIDSSSATLLALVASGTQLKAARLNVVYIVGDVIYSTRTIDLRDVTFTSVVTGSETEAITLSFQRSKVTK